MQVHATTVGDYPLPDDYNVRNINRLRANIKSSPGSLIGRQRNADSVCRVLLLDSDPEHASDLEYALICAGLQVSVFRDREMVVEALRRGFADFAVVVLRSPSWWRHELKLLCDAIRQIEQPPEIVCVLRWPANGPGDRLFGDELQVGVVHER